MHTRTWKCGTHQVGHHSSCFTNTCHGRYGHCDSCILYYDNSLILWMSENTLTIIFNNVDSCHSISLAYIRGWKCHKERFIVFKNTIIYNSDVHTLHSTSQRTTGKHHEEIYHSVVINSHCRILDTNKMKHCLWYCPSIPSLVASVTLMGMAVMEAPVSNRVVQTCAVPSPSLTLTDVLSIDTMAAKKISRYYCSLTLSTV